MPNIFKDGGGAGIGSYVVVFKNGQLAENTDPTFVRRAYEAGDQIYVSIIDAQTKDALVPASGWIDEEGKLHLIARDFDDDKTYTVAITDSPLASEIDIEAEVDDGVKIGDSTIMPNNIRFVDHALIIGDEPEQEAK